MSRRYTVENGDSDLEERLARMLTAQAEAAPSIDGLVDPSRRRLKRRRVGLVTVAALAALVTILGVRLVGADHSTIGTTNAPFAQTDLSSSTPSTQRFVLRIEGPLWRTGAASECVEQYGTQALQRRSFAFDGVVADIAAGLTNRPNGGRLPLRAVTFDVQEWFRGGSEPQVTVDMYPPRDGAAPIGAESHRTYSIGTRLLVTGEPRWGGDRLEDAIAWGCGFTRYYDPDTASAWHDAFLKP